MDIIGMERSPAVRRACLHPGAAPAPTHTNSRRAFCLFINSEHLYRCVLQHRVPKSAHCFVDALGTASFAVTVMFVSGLPGSNGVRCFSPRREHLRQCCTVRRLQCAAQDLVQPNEEFELVVSDEPLGPPDSADEEATPVAASGRGTGSEAVAPGEGGRTRGERRRSLRSSASWANIFVAPFGRKGTGSRPHLDLRPPSVQTRGASDVITCPDCKGTGLSICYICNGSHFYKPNGEVIECPACHGEGRRTCIHCYGQGKVAELGGDWWKYGVLNWFQRRGKGM
jgi:hypothetical protein